MHALFPNDVAATEWTVTSALNDFIGTCFAATPMTTRNKQKIALTFEADGAFYSLSLWYLPIWSSGCWTTSRCRSIPRGIKLFETFIARTNGESPRRE